MSNTKTQENYIKQINSIIRKIGDRLNEKYPTELPAKTFVIEEAYLAVDNDLLQRTVNLGKVLEKETPNTTDNLIEMIVDNYFSV